MKNYSYSILFLQLFICRTILCKHHKRKDDLIGRRVRNVEETCVYKLYKDECYDKRFFKGNSECRTKNVQLISRWKGKNITKEAKSSFFHIETCKSNCCDVEWDILQYLQNIEAKCCTMEENRRPFKIFIYICSGLGALILILIIVWIACCCCRRKKQILEDMNFEQELNEEDEKKPLMDKS